MDPRKFFIEQFIYWNRDIIPSFHDPKISEFADLNLDLLNKEQIHVRCYNLMEQLVNLQRKNFLIIDEHNEIIRQNKRHADFFQNFTKFHAIVNGKQNFVYFIGSGNSEFLYSLPDGQSQYIFRIVPMNEIEFDRFLQRYLQGNSFWEKIDWSELVKVTGRVPRNLFSLLKLPHRETRDDTLQYFAQLLQENFFNRLDRFQPETLRSSLEKIFGAGIFEYSHATGLYDMGIVYRTNESFTLYIINDPARKALLQLYCKGSSNTP